MKWLIHEMTHAWQFQQGMWVKLRSAAYHVYNYGDISKATKRFYSYGVEQQACIVADYFLIMNKKKPQNGNGSRADYIKLIPFSMGKL